MYKEVEEVVLVLGILLVSIAIGIVAHNAVVGVLIFFGSVLLVCGFIYIIGDYFEELEKKLRK